jgi:hypothetical protein
MGTRSEAAARAAPGGAVCRRAERVVVALGLMVLFLAEGSPFLVEAFRGILAAAGGLFGG